MPLIEIEDDTFVSKTFRNSNNPDYRLLETMQPSDIIHLIAPEDCVDEEPFTKWRNAVSTKCRTLSKRRGLQYTVTRGEAKCMGGLKQVLRVACNLKATNMLKLAGAN